MENYKSLDNAGASKHFECKAEGGQYFGLWISNLLLTIFTLGIYYPWAKTKDRKYFYSNTFLGEHPFEYHGTAMELFKGFIKAIAVIIIPYLALVGVILLDKPILTSIAAVIFYLYILIIIPFAIFGSLKYNTSRASWNSIFFRFSGHKKEFVKLFLTNVFLIIISLGFYGAWAGVKIRRYILEHLHLGNINATYKANGLEIFLIHLKGVFLTMFSLGIYSFWYAKNLFNYQIEHTELEQNGTTIQMHSTLTGGDIFGLAITNFVFTVFTLGLATPWIVIRTIKVYLDNISLDDNFKPNEIIQGKIDNYTDATGDDFLDIIMN